MWTGTYFQKTTLREEGLTVQLMHAHDTPCFHPCRRVKKFAVCDLSGFHEVNITFCGCLQDDDNPVPMWIQLLRIGWYPSSTVKPSTAFTLPLLDFYQQLHFQAKTNLYDFQRTLSKITDNTGRKIWVSDLLHTPHFGTLIVTQTVQNRYRPLSDAVRQYRNLVLLKRGGRCHDPSGILGTPEGSLAVVCPACPHPGRNIPDDWANAPPEILYVFYACIQSYPLLIGRLFRWLYTLFLMLDANFKLRVKDRGIEDIELAPGWAYYVNEELFQRHIDEHHRVHGDALEVGPHRCFLFAPD